MAQIILDSNNNLIQGDFDNATLNNRTKLQTTTTNATTNVYVVPNGSSTSAGVSVANNSSLTNASKIVMATNGATDTQIISGVNGSGSYLPLSFYTNNALAGQFTTAGNLTVTGSVTATGGFVQGATAAPTFSANAGSGQSLSNGTGTKLVYATEDWDTNSNYDTTLSRFTPTVAGYYQVSASVYIGGTNNMELAIRKNGSEYIRFSQLSGFNICGSGIVNFNGSTDYIEAWMFNGNGSTVTVNGYTFAKFQAALIRSA
jgi:hypothetical protein